MMNNYDIIMLVIIMDYVFAIFSLVLIIFGIIILAFWFISNKKRKIKIARNDYEKVKIFYENILKNNRPSYSHDCYAAVDYLETIKAICEEFLKGHKNVGQEENDLIENLKDNEIINEMKKLNLIFLTPNINEILLIIYKYYDKKGVWKNEK